MLQTRIVRLAALVFAAAAPISSFAQVQISQPSHANAAFSLDQVVPQYRPFVLQPSATRVPLAAKPALDTDAGFIESMDRVIDRAMYKAPRKRVAD